MTARPLRNPGRLDGGADLLALIENCPVEAFEVVDRAGGRVKIAPHGSSDLLIELQTV